MSLNIDETLKQQAIDWLVRLRAGDLTDAEMSAFAVWLAADYRHSEAFAFAEDLFDDMVVAAGLVSAANVADDIKSPGLSTGMRNRSSTFEQGSSGRTLPNRFRWGRAVLAIAAVWLFAVILVMPEQAHPFANLLSDYHTETGELRDIELTDGSHMLLNTNSAVSVVYDESKRHIVLHHGQVRFTVAKDNRRPFDVITDEFRVRALGTVFEVYRPDGDNVSVTVQQHAVTVAIGQDAGSAQEASFMLRAGQNLRYRFDGNPPTVRQVELDQASAWQQRRLFINDRPLGELIAELNRYRVGRIFLSDAQLSDLRVTGVFPLDKPDDILRAVSEVLGLQETRLGPLWVLLRR
ncbi:FecR family protein [Methylomonas methanica]|uniref:Anti-FecI sigma factor, FecR n=1 Tax=Methylomonas methanica (strain DSM 25384 / MC09) TaxID=857087 RepID=G0A2S1_METMM|nr:FecR family protein [Methylomonas methanica]AEG01424.1 anti-FecI sigma factor, FecR [Methylomonas methanica MC09]